MKKGPFKMKNPIKIGQKILETARRVSKSDFYKSRPRRARKGFGAKVKGLFGL